MRDPRLPISNEVGALKTRLSELFRSLYAELESIRSEIPDDYIAPLPDETPDHNDLSGMQGGNSAERYHLTSAQHAEVTVLRADLADDTDTGKGAGLIGYASTTIKAFLDGILNNTALTGTPTAPTAAPDTNTTQIATTAHVFAERTNAATLTNKTLTAPVMTAPVLGTPASGVATNLTGTAAGLTAGNVTTNANLTGDVTSVGNATTLTNAPVIAKVLTGYTSGAGTVAATDSILQAIQKLNGNDATNANLTGPITSVGNATSIASQTGTGSTFVMSAGPTLTAPLLGTPASGTLTNCTGLPAAGVTGTALVAAAIGTTVQAYDADLTTWAGVTPGTGVGTALAVNVGTAGAFVVNGGVLGTPSSGTVTNLTGTASINVNGTVGATTPSTGAFTTLTTTGAAYVGDTSNANMTLGLTINQGAADNEILALKSSDVAHGMTTATETDNFADFVKASPTVGGVLIRGWSASTLGVGIYGAVTTATTTKTTGATAAITINGRLKSGTSVATLGANGNIAAFQDSGTTRFILDADGDSHQDVGTAWTNFDHLDDVATLDALAYNVARDSDPIKEKFGTWLAEKREVLEQQKLVKFNEDGHHFVNMSKLTMLHTGAIRQIGERLDALVVENALLKANIARLTER